MEEIQIKPSFDEIKRGAKMKIYISGKISGNKDYENDFGNIELYLRRFAEFDDDLQVYNPARIDYGTYEKNLLMNIKKIFECDAIFMMKNWMDSPGAMAEYHVAKAIKMPIFYEVDQKNDEKILSLYKIMKMNK